MTIPTNIERLIHGKVVESERIEFKKSWNPEDIVHSMCAFANDIHNLGGGYIIVGIEENNGRPILPPTGLEENQIDAFQKKVIELGYKINPSYFPIIQPYTMDDNHILVIWCPAGDNRPYDAPHSLSKGNTKRFSYVRIGSNTIQAKDETLRQLQELTARIPFDDRLNNQAKLEDLDLGLIREYLQEIGSSLADDSTEMKFSDLCRTMMIAKGPDEDIRPLNVGLLFFNKQPDQFFDRAWIELVWHKDDSGKEFTEKYFKGPLNYQINGVLDYIKNNIIEERVVKLPHTEKALRAFNYPYAALEEIIANAVYHKSYELRDPIEIQIFPDKITVLSYPGPMPPVNHKDFATQKRIVARKYRNRRIGDFLKELDLTEGRGTGFPAIYRAMERNGSPNPIFETDDSNYVLVTLDIHPEFLKSDQANDQASDQANDQASDQANTIIINTLEGLSIYLDSSNDQANDQAIVEVNESIINELNEKINDRVIDILKITSDWKSRDEILETIGYKNHTDNRKKYIDPLVEYGWIEIRYPDTPTHPNQGYKITAAGKRLLELITE